MKTLILFVLLLSTTFLCANEVAEHKKLPLSKSLPYLQSIEDQAMHIGSGPIKVYVFLDPLCPNSRNFLSLINESKKMQSRYHYYLFLYTLERFHSEDLVRSIYNSADPLKSALKVMVHKETLSPNQATKSDHKIQSIADVAQKIDVYKRPYLVLVKKPKKRKSN